LKPPLKLRSLWVEHEAQRRSILPHEEAPMKDLAGKVAFITGGGSGVALGQA
jgi:hypothetical protein